MLKFSYKSETGAMDVEGRTQTVAKGLRNVRSEKNLWRNQQDLGINVDSGALAETEIGILWSCDSHERYRHEYTTTWI